MSIKIQINNLEALERLIGGDSELEIDIRNSVVQEFASKHLKALVNNSLMASSAEATLNEIKSEFFETTKSAWGNSTIVFKNDTLEKLRDDLRIEAKRVLRKIVSEVVEEANSKTVIKEALNNATNRILNDLLDVNLATRLDRLVDQRLKEKLGLK